jgi:diaminopimelate epimerase
VNFVKMHGTGNDFVVVSGATCQPEWARLAVAICDRHFGVGADGLLVALPSDTCDLRMRMFNPDGSEAEMCGNGIRCLAKYAIESGMATAVDGRITVETMAGNLPCEVFTQTRQVELVRVGMGKPRLRPSEIPVLGKGEGPLQDLSLSTKHFDGAVTCVSMGNPHAVHFTQTAVDDVALELAGPEVENHPLFPKRVNFEIVNVLGPGRLAARVWERGAGLTLACGTGACAVGVAAQLAGFSNGASSVRLPGGTLEIEWDGIDDVYLSGPAVEVFRGEWLEASVPAAAEIGS